MDIPAPQNSSKVNSKALIASFLLILIIGFTWISFSDAKPTHSVNLDDIMIATVIKEDFIVDVRAPGTLQPTSLRWIAASSEGRVEQIYVQPGARVKQDTLIMQLSNPTLVRNHESAGYALQVEEAELKALDKRLQSNYLSQEAVVADFEARYQNATFRLKANKALSGLKVVSELDAKENELQQAQLSRQLSIEKKDWRNSKHLTKQN
jgi:multidrug efflux pump subunit AcrA (membrane-fusion protein)